MIETLHMIIEVLATAKVEMGVFLLAACIHFVLFSNYAPAARASLLGEKSSPKLAAAGATGGATRRASASSTGNSMAQALKEPLRAKKAEKQWTHEELQRLLDFHHVPEEDVQAVLAFALEGIGRLAASEEFLAGLRSLVGPVTSPQLAAQLLRNYWGAQAYANFESLLFEFSEFCQTHGIKMPRQVVVMAVQFASGDELETADTIPKRSAWSKPTWTKLEKIMMEFVPTLDDDAAKYVSFHRILDGIVKRDASPSSRCWDTVQLMEQAGLVPNNVTCSILLKTVTKHHQDSLPRIIKLIDSREVKDIDEVLLGSLFEACIRSGQMKEMLQYVQKLRREGDLVEIRSAHTAGSIIRAYGTAQDLDGVWATWNDMKLRGVQPTRITLGCMVEALASNDDQEGAYQIIQQALADPHTAHLVNAVTYSSVLKSFNHRKLFHRVWEVYDEMIQQKVEFSVSTYNALLDVCARSGNISRAEPLLKDMADQGVAPSIITFSTVIKAYCAANRLEQAFRIFEEMRRNTEIKADEVTFNTLMDGCARYGLFDRGLQVLMDMQKSGIAPSNYTLSVVAKLASRSKKPKKAFSLVEDLRKEYGIKLNMHVYNNLIQAAIGDNDSWKAQEVFAEMLKSNVQPDGRTYNLLLRFLVSERAVVSLVALLRVALGLKLQMHEDEVEHLHPSLVSALQRPMEWAKAPFHGKAPLQEDVLREAIECAKHSAVECSSKLVADIQRSLPWMKMTK